MKNGQISLQKAVAILRKELFKKGDYDKIFKDFKAGESILLKTGAKLVKYDTGIFIYGYHYAGEDVDYYLKKKGR